MRSQRNRIITHPILATLAALTTLIASPLYGASSANAPFNGSYGANGAGTGGAIGALVDDPSAIFWNPAGLSHIYQAPGEQDLVDEAEEAFSEENFENFLEGPKEEEPTPTPAADVPFHFQIFTSYDHLTLGRQQIFGSVAMTAFGGVIGAGFIASQVLDIPSYDANAVSLGAVNYQNLSALVGYAWSSGMTRIGITLNGFQETLGNTAIYGGGLNAGVQLSPIPILHIGMNLKNLAGIYQVTSYLDSPVEKLDTFAELSIAFVTPPPKSNVKLMFAIMANLDDPDIQSAIEARLGIIMELSNAVYLMGGLNNGNLALGFGVNVGFFHMAYSIDRDPLDTGFQHHIELNFHF